MARPGVPEIALSDPRERARLLALRSLRNCGVIRVTMGEVPLGYRLLAQEQAVRATKTRNPNKADCRLTDLGRDLARKLLK